MFSSGGSNIYSAHRQTIVCSIRKDRNVHTTPTTSIEILKTCSVIVAGKIGQRYLMIHLFTVPIKGNDFWILTYPAWKDDMRERVAGMMDHQLVKGFGG